MKTNLLLSSLILLSIVLFSGCASKMQAPKNSGFFKSYEHLQVNSNHVSDAVKLAAYKKIYVEEVSVIPSIALEEQTSEQKQLYTGISKYATNKLKEALKFKNSNEKTKDSLVMQSAISASEVHFDDKEWNQLSPLSLGITVVSLNAYLEESARLVGEYRLIAKDETISKSLKQIKEIPISLNGDYLTLDDLKSSIDAWVDIVASEINKGNK
ncbi:MAG: DUF3313 domain-containing protein [Thiovulaceae bacterium]|nr:DUF3313 domain-containing protein [Sulfurimonadaceae bacterium]MCW9025776.1 DUF3313 domain-containing protein [Sulfurimonadaceae bacterium]